MRKKQGLFRSNRTLGVYSAVLFRQALSVLGMHGSKAKLILVTCSPAKRLGARTQDHMSLDELIKSVNVLEPMHLRHLRDLFGHRLLVLHQQSLLEPKAYEDITRFLGIRAPERALNALSIQAQWEFDHSVNSYITVI